MKKLILPIIALIFLYACSNEKSLQNKYNINGTVEIDSLNGKFVYLFSSVQSMDSAIAYAQIIDNKFNISNSTLVQPYSAPLVVGEKDGSLLKPYLGSTIIIEPGDIDVHILKNSVTEISGTPLNDMFNECEYATIAYDSLCNKIFNKDIDANSKRIELMQLKQNRANTIYNALINYTNYEVASEVLSLTYLYMTSEQLRNITKETNSAIKNTRIFNLIEHTMNTSIGDKFIDISLPCLNGDTVAFSDFIDKSKYTLIQFWASWCGPCLRLLPEIGNLYNSTSRDEFNVISISLDSNNDAWRKATKQMAPQWIQLSSLKAWNCDAAIQYGINYIPSTILIDRNGTIVARNADINELKIFLAK